MAEIFQSRDILNDIYFVLYPIFIHTFIVSKVHQSRANRCTTKVACIFGNRNITLLQKKNSITVHFLVVHELRLNAP